MSAAASQVVGPELTDVQAVVEQVWSSFLGDEEPLLPRYDAPAAFDALAAWSAAVGIHGGWEGTVTVEVSDRLAGTLTEVMLGVEPGAVDDSEIADAVGELVNMVGGNIKSLMPGPSTLTLPNVAAGRAAHATDTAEVARLDASWLGQPVRVSVHAPRHA
jgi:chemotaxis protein CheX